MKDQTRYIFSTGDLIQKDFSIDFKTNKGHNYVPIENIKELYLFNDCTITTKLLNILGKQGIIIHFYDYYNNYTGSFYPKEQLLSGNLTVKQALYFDKYRIEIAKAFVIGIANNIRFVLYHYFRHGVVELKPFIDYLKEDVPNLLLKADNIKIVLSIEGSIWAKFYNNFKYFLPEDFLINKRVRRPPDNPMNALISFGNSILYNKTVTQIYYTHLNQSISFLHEPSEQRFSLSLDIAEAFKPLIVFRTIFDLVNNKKIKISKHFDKDFNYALLNDAGKKIFIEAFDERINSTFKHTTLKRQVSYRQAIRLDGYKLIKQIIEGKEFIPFNENEKK